MSSLLSNPAELILCAIAGGVAAFVFLRNWRQSDWRPTLIPLAALLLFAGFALVWRPTIDAGLSRQLPRRVERDGFVSSNSCRSCHPGYYASWHDSFHRTMTQVANPQTVRAPFDGIVLKNRGRTYQLERRGEEFWVTMPDPDWEESAKLGGVDLASIANPPLAVKRIVLVTGSHHMQNYWVHTQRGHELFMLPFCYHLERERWFPSEDSFLKPPDAPRTFSYWNSNCIRCHSVAGNPGLDPKTIDLQRNPSGVLDSEVAEFGISCEACHGPAERHVAHHRNPLNRYGRRSGAAPDPTIVNPADCASEISSQICGQCHSNFVAADLEGSFLDGLSYRAGGDLKKSHAIVRFSAEEAEHMPRNDKVSFWQDGTSCVGGDEYNGLIESPCHQRGKLSCLSCHSMHQSDPNDQLAADREGNQACTQCHDDRRFRDQIEQHTHHSAASSGSQCYNCHMPHTSFALLTAMRSHRIDSPDVALSQRTGRPNACNLCHIEKPLAWAADRLVDWYDAPPVELNDDERQTSAALLWLLRGDALQRVIAAWHLGWEPALWAAGTQWQAPFLAHALDDPYAAVRFVAERSLRRFPEYDSIPYDFLGRQQDRAKAGQAVIERWNAEAERRSVKAPAELLLTPDRRLQLEAVARLLEQRNDRPITLPE